jgi:WD40 repeat protein/mono/diheme cytochrome c family protein
MSPARLLFLAVPALALAAPAAARAGQPEEKKDGPVSYYRDVRPVFALHCTGCHQPAKPQGGYVMTDYASLLKAGDQEQPGVVPGKPDASKIVEQVRVGSQGKAEMPKGKDPLPAKDIDLIKRWIAEGARDDTPPSARLVAVDADHPPVYHLPPVITSVEYSPDGSLLAVAGYHEVLLWKADGSELVARLVGQAERVQSVAFSPDGQSLAVAGGSPGRFGEVQVWDVAKHKLRLSVPMTFDTVYGISWSPDGTKLAFGCADNTLRAVDATSGQQVLYQGAHNDWVLGTVFSRDGKYLASVSRDRTVKLTEVATQRFIDNVTSITPGALKGGLSAVARNPAQFAPPKDKVVNEDKVGVDTAERFYDELLIGGSDGVPRLYKMHRTKKRVIGDDFNKIREFPALPGRVYAVCFSPDGKLCAAGSSLDGKGELRVYQTADAKQVSKLELATGVYALSWRADGQHLAVAGFDGVVRLIEPSGGKVVKEFTPVSLAETKKP